MAAVLSLKYRDEGGDPQFAYQILIHPWMQVCGRLYHISTFMYMDIYKFILSNHTIYQVFWPTLI